MPTPDPPHAPESDSFGPPLIDERAAMWAASLVAPSRRDDPATARALRAEIASDVPDLDVAARRWSGLGHGLPPTQARVVGRLGWIRINLSSLRGAFAPLRDKLGGNRAVASRVVGVQVGALLGLLSTKVLGQFVLPFGGPGGGELLVVGPNVLALGERQGDLAVDVRRTVVLHEITHRLQFDGNPWLGDHLRGLVRRYLAEARVDRAAVLELAPRLPRLVAEVRETGTIEPLIGAVLTDAQARIVAEAQGLMSLLEGHGNTAMFEAATGGLIADPDAVRGLLAQRHGDVASKVLAVAGMEMKRRQYREGEQFVRGVIELGGVEALNRAFTAAEHLPLGDEVGDPAGWLARVRAA
ncbi:MAG TPA: zinc-dependent metalloprotease [Egicoccus sp.]|nr:zinc-dependent metalloprotease [Egicoccus sp.]HSK24756.1 zinc-dependent metalloprotease [Egicoccus sp.]